jgi:phosphoglycolate phosphatase-like HAD superfamily hydrolase
VNLIVFDLDGTLTKTNAVDDICFVQAFADTFGMRLINTSWEEYEHATDLGILQQAFVQTFNRPLGRPEISRFIECFLGLLKKSHAGDANLFGEIPGAASLLSRLKDNSEWSVAIATGCWEASARFKIQMARTGADDLPAAFAEDGPSREAVVKTAIERAGGNFEKIVSVGDATWDVKTAGQLGLPFLGIGGARRAERLRQAGASHTIDNFLDPHQFLHYIAEVEVPRLAAAQTR